MTQFQRKAIGVKAAIAADVLRDKHVKRMAKNFKACMVLNIEYGLLCLMVTMCMSSRAKVSPPERKWRGLGFINWDAKLTQ